MQGIVMVMLYQNVYSRGLLLEQHTIGSKLAKASAQVYCLEQVHFLLLRPRTPAQFPQLRT